MPMFKPPLTAKMRENPIVYKEYLDEATTNSLPVLTDELLYKIFPRNNSFSINTWDRLTKVRENDVHMTGLKGSIGFHTDPAFPRFTHQLKLRVDQEIYTVGWGGVRLNLVRGLFYILDTHSPHKIDAPDNQSFNISVSIDSKTPYPSEQILPTMIAYARSLNDDLIGEK